MNHIKVIDLTPVKLDVETLMAKLDAVIDSYMKESATKEKFRKREKNVEIPSDLTYYFKKVADKKGWSVERVDRWLGNIADVHPMAAINIILKEIAVELDKKYTDHISNSKDIFCISSINGEICKLDKSKIKSYKHFAAFRTFADANIAFNMLATPLKSMFK
jgi:hypothetical protein